MTTASYSLSDHILRIIIVGCLVLLLIIGRLVQLQIQESDTFFSRSQQNFLRIEATPSLRGNIIAHDGTLLATNRPVINVYWQGTGSRRLYEKDKKTLKKLERLLGISLLSDTFCMNSIYHAQRYYKKTVLAKDISFTQLSKISEQFPGHQNIIIDTHFKRFYPYKSYASHILGSLATLEAGTVGTMGLEKLLETSLQGQNGTCIKKINSFGRNLAQIELDKSLNGKTIATTLDITLQTIVERVFPQDYTGTCIIMDPHDGSIKALLSRPNFDPALFLQPISTKRWKTLQEKHPFLNRAFSACYPPGSIFKLVTISAAIEHNIIPMESLWQCKGYTTFCNRKYWCNRHYGHGQLTTRQALAQSCNILFFEIGRNISIDVLADYAHRFGLGQPTNVMFPEKTGLIPTTEWKETVKGERWWTGETLSATIGQSFLLVSPIQVARMIASIFTGYLVKPRILASEAIEMEPLAIAPTTLAFLKDSMKKVVTKGTGRRVNTIKDIEIFAKTSTAQTSDKKKRHLGNKYLEHGWFVAHVKYKQERPFTLVILVEHAGASRVPTMVAKNFLIEYKKMVDTRLS